MPLEIDEIGVRLEVGQESGAAEGSAPADGGELPPEDKDEVAKAAARDVLETLRDEEAR